MDSCFIMICKFASFKNNFATVATLSELYFRLRIFNLLVQTKKVISINYGISKSIQRPNQKCKSKSKDQELANSYV